ncbi:MAG: amidohydrolase family protein, partial [Acidobacteriota bacterium]
MKNRRPTVGPRPAAPAARGLLALGAVCLAAAALAQAPPPPVAFVHVTVVSPEGEAQRNDQTVLAREGRIEASGPSSSIALPPGTQVVDGSGLFLAPGLVDAHVHLDAMVGARPGFGDAPLFLAHGVTTVINLRGDEETLRVRRRIEEGSHLAPTLYTSGEFVNEPRVTTPAEAEAEAASQSKSGFDVIKFREVIDFEKNRVATTKGLERAALLRLNEAARKRGLPVLGHAPYRAGLDGLLEARMSLAHSNELANLHFLPPLDLSRGAWMSLLRWSLAALAVSLLLGGLYALVRRVRRGAFPRQQAPGTGLPCAA